MYKIFNILSVIIREFYLPNPFLPYFTNTLYAEMFNVFIGGWILHMFSFLLTGSIYKKGKYPSSVGCFLYCINYIFNTILIFNLSNILKGFKVDFLIIVVLIINVILYILFSNIFDKTTKYKML